MLCQDPLKSSEMLANVHSVTELGGSYVILTIHPEELIQGILAVYGFKHLSERRIQFNGCVGMVWVKETVRGQRASRETGRSMTREHVGKRYGTGKEEQKNNTRMVTGEAWRRETYSRLIMRGGSSTLPRGRASFALIAMAHFSLFTKCSAVVGVVFEKTCFIVFWKAYSSASTANTFLNQKVLE
eukprot:GEMP01072262.1.p1 GENE.GEMP01072262.1~~GEMP01072262.1.p1  ORF type:complete len:185 (+),score=15.41 GEMP01072262.1:626-1180(+)